MSCPGCLSGAVLEGEPKGRETTLHGRPTYVAEPPAGAAPAGLVVIVPDAFGWRFVNNRLLCDHYAREGRFLVYLPDFMDGSAVPAHVLVAIPNLLYGPWLARPYHLWQVVYRLLPFIVWNRLGVAMPKVESFFRAVRTSAPGSGLGIGAAGFCWGGKHIMNLADGRAEAGGGKPLVDAAFTAHPSLLAVPAEIAAVTQPVSVAIGDNDAMLGMDKVQQIKQIWAKKARDDGLKTEVKVYPGAGHGFAIRGDPFNDKQETQSAEAARQAVAWFTKSFEAVKY